MLFDERFPDIDKNSGIALIFDENNELWYLNNKKFGVKEG